MSKNLKVPAAMTQRMTIVLIAISVLVLLIGGGGIYFLQTKQSEADKVVADKEALVGTNEQVAKRYDVTLASYNTSVDQLKYVEPTMSKASYVATLIQQLQKETLADHLTLSSVRPGIIDDDGAAAGNAAAKAAPLYDEANVELNVTGTYTQIMTFVYHMTRFPKVVSVQSVSFSPQGGGVGSTGATSAPLLGASISLFAYIFPDGPAIVSPVAPVADGNFMTRATANIGDAIRAAVPLPSVADRSDGLVESAATIHPAKEGSVQ